MTGRRNARRASVERIFFAHAASSRRVRGPADEDALAARGVSGPGGVEGAADLDAAKIGALLRRVVAVRSARDRLLERLEQIFEQRRRAVEERQRDRPRPGLRRKADLPICIERPAVLAACRPRPALPASGQQLEDVHRRAVDAELEPLRLVEDRNFVEAGAGVARQLHANAVVAVPREGIAQRGAAARAERQPVQAIVLPQLGRNEERVGGRRPRRRADRDAADLLAPRARYRSINVGDIRCTPAMLSNP